MDTKTSPLAALADPTLLKTDALIGGEWHAGGARFDVSDPATGRKLADVANLGAADTAAAIAAASARLARLARQDRQGARRGPDAVVRAAAWRTPTTWRAS